MDNKEIINMMNCSLDSNLNFDFGNQQSVEELSMKTEKVNSMYNYSGGAWDYWQNYYYPSIIRESYPIYIQDRAQDKGKQAFEIIKHLQDKKLMKLDAVRDFIEAMDTLLKIL